MITIGVGLIIAFFFAFETRFRRSTTAIDGQVMVHDDFGNTRILSGEEALSYLAEQDDSIFQECAVQKKTYPQLLKPWSGLTPNGGRIVLNAYVNIFEAFTSPGLLYALLVATIVLG